VRTLEISRNGWASILRQRIVERTAEDEMHHGVDNAEETDRYSSDLVKIYVMIQGHDGVETVRPQKRDALPQHQDQDECAIEVQALSWETH